MHERFQTLEASPDAAYHQGRHLRGRPRDRAVAAESARFRGWRPGPGRSVPEGLPDRTRRIDPPPVRRSAVAADARTNPRPRPYTIQPILGHESGTSSERTRAAAPISWSRKAAGAYIQRRVKRYRTHKTASALAIESAAIIQKIIQGMHSPSCLAFGYRWVVTQEKVACNIAVSSVTNAVRVLQPLRTDRGSWPRSCTPSCGRLLIPHESS
jgi:hypothetical protein